jgi:lipopolysaccharide biosynthesis regulator YciM
MTLDLERSAGIAETSEFVGVEAGARGAGDYRCLDCGYGIVTFGVVPTCPMCHGDQWESTRWSPFTARSASREALAEH